MRITVDIIGQDEVVGALNKLDLIAVARVAQAVRDTALAVERDAKLLAPVRTGRMRSNIGTQFYENGLAAEVGTNIEYAPPVEFGTGPRIIRPVRAQALRFTAGGRVVFAKRVNHPGTKARPFLFPAWEQQKPEFTRRIQAALRHAVDAASNNANAT